MSSTTLAGHIVPHTDAVYYIPDFVYAEEEEFLIRKIRESPLPKWKQLANRRLQVWGGSLTSKKVLLPERVPAFVERCPDIIGRIKATGAFRNSPHGAPNHILMNEYLPGQGIMPHEDGPAYFPVVATLTLGSHAMFNYYRYQPQEGPLDREVHGEGRAVDTHPILSVLLEPRSLVITTSSFYKSCLHGIDEATEDNFSFSSPRWANCQSPPIRVANVHLLTGAAGREAVLNGGVLRRGVRYSLTCRDVERVASVLPFAKR